MNSRNRFILQHFSTFFLLLSILLITGCDNVQLDILEKNKLSDVRNTITAIAQHSETSSEQITELLTEKSTELSTALDTQSLIDVPYVRSFDAYIKQNADFMGWLTIPGTSIDEPIVQGNDNAHYLEYDVTNTKSIKGAVFLDYKNQGNFYDNHMSLYAHYMEDGSMFHDLHKYKEKDFLEAYPEIILSGLRETKTYEIFSVHIVSAADYYLYLDLNDEALKEYAAHFERLSMVKPSVEFPEDLKLLTLVTCTYEFENARLLIHAYQK